MSTQRIPASPDLSLVGPEDGPPEAQLRSDRAYALLRQELLSCAIPPGSVLSEAEVMRNYDLGRATCRAALHRLAQDGLLRTAPRQGYFVLPVTPADVAEVYALRLELEPFAARLAAERRPQIAALKRLERACRTGVRDAGNGLTLFLDANRAFHLAIVAASGNGRLLRIVTGLQDEMTRVVALGFGRRGRAEDIKDEHHDIIAALENGDGRRAEAAMRRHLEASHRLVRQQIAESAPVANTNLTPLTTRRKS